MHQDSEALNLEQVLSILRRRAPLILLCTVVLAGVALGLSKHQTKKYTATASLAFSINPLSQQIAGLPAVSSNNLLALQASNVELVKLGDMAAKTASLLGHGLTEGKVGNSLSISGQGESSVVDVSATVSSPALAAEIANTYARQFVKEQQSANHQYFKSALALVHKQLAALPPQQRFGADGLALQNRAQTLGFLSELRYGNVQVAQEASAPNVPSSPKTSRNTILGGVIGLLIGLGLAFLLARIDRRIGGAEDLETIYELPLLGAVPDSAALSKPARQGTTLPPAEAEAFQLILAHLRFFNVDRDLRTVLIASAEPDDGKTTIARHLAEAAARMGARVLLLEADLRRPTLAQHLDLPTGPGLTDALIGSVAMNEATQSIDLGTSPGVQAGEGALDVLVSGAMRPPNPGKLTGSSTMQALMDQARSTYDLVVIDAPPLIAISDAFSLLGKVDGVVIVGRVRHSRRDLAERLRQVLASSGAPLLGVIANGVKSSLLGSRVYAAGDDPSPRLPPVNSNGASSSGEFLPTVKT